ncbi:Crp/Fnr family transcriptional regulator [Rhodoligotrophos appendicifer]|uniref:Crp/Fnr family transcriptional regulator n=1 Tax=Rhodoligotrophos appendicifer TaxID=987056 RepID=UPI003D190074
MSAEPKLFFKNGLLNALRPSDLARLMPHLEPVELKLRDVLVPTDTLIAYVYFLESGIGSIVASSPDGQEIEVGHVGWEGMSGRSVVLGVNRTPNRTFMQVAGHGFRLKSSELAVAMEESPSLRALMFRYIQAFEIQVEHSALAAGRYGVIARLARWLLMCHDRSEGNDLYLTHKFLALMLGVRRSGVTDELHKLEGLLLIKSTRSNVHIRDREGLIEVAGGCYGVPEREYKRLITDFRHGNGSAVLS